MPADSIDLVDLYIEEQISVAKRFPARDVAVLCNLIVAAYNDEKTVYIAANGGGAAFCDNLQVDLRFHPFVSDDKARPVPEGVKRMKVVNLAASPATLTGVMNDLGPDLIFAQQLEGHIKKGDIFLGFSGSGNSGNILQAIAVAQKHGAFTVAITRGTGGACKEKANFCIVIPGTSKFPGQVGKNDNNFHFEDSLSSVSHMIVGILQKHVRTKYGIESQGE